MKAAEAADGVLASPAAPCRGSSRRIRGHWRSLRGLRREARSCTASFESHGGGEAGDTLDLVEAAHPRLVDLLRREDPSDEGGDRGDERHDADGRQWPCRSWPPSRACSWRRRRRSARARLRPSPRPRISASRAHGPSSFSTRPAFSCRHSLTWRFICRNSAEYNFQSGRGGEANLCCGGTGLYIGRFFGNRYAGRG